MLHANRELGLHLDGIRLVLSSISDFSRQLTVQLSDDDTNAILSRCIDQRDKYEVSYREVGLQSMKGMRLFVRQAGA